MSTEVINTDELKWRARDDARTLSRAEEIKADKARLEYAKKEAQTMMEERAKELRGLCKVAGVSNVATPTTNTRRDIVHKNNVQPFGGFPTSPRF